MVPIVVIIEEVTDVFVAAVAVSLIVGIVFGEVVVAVDIMVSISSIAVRLVVVAVVVDNIILIGKDVAMCIAE